MNTTTKHVAVFGAAGGTGSEIVKQAIAKGYTVTALARTECDVLDADAVRAALKPETTAVFCALGAPKDAPTTVFSQGVANIVAAMSGLRIQRFVGIAASAMYIDSYDNPLTRVAKPILQRIFRHPYTDMHAMEALLRQSSIDWTLVVPPKLTEGSATWRYRTALGHNVPWSFTLSRADLADCMLAIVDDPATFRGLTFAAK